jgi:anti-sigma B factor antagonist
MEIEIILRDNKLNHIALRGRLDTAAARDFEAEFLKNTSGIRKPALVDLSELAFLSSMGIRMLLRAAMELEKQGLKMAIINLPPLAEKAVRSAGLDILMHIARNHEEALSFLV